MDTAHSIPIPVSESKMSARRSAGVCHVRAHSTYELVPSVRQHMDSSTFNYAYNTFTTLPVPWGSEPPHINTGQKTSCNRLLLPQLSCPSRTTTAEIIYLQIRTRASALAHRLYILATTWTVKEMAFTQISLGLSNQPPTRRRSRLRAALK